MSAISPAATHGHREATHGRILLVEDNPEAALFAVHVLTKRAHFEVTHTADPAVALSLAAAGHWDLVLTDLEMPGMTGLELLHALRQAAPALPVAVMTAHAPTGTMHEALLSEADAYLSKPIRIDQLISTATDLIRNGRKIRSTSGDDG
jgi:CheY-like chemotaxis protein